MKPGRVILSAGALVLLGVLVITLGGWADAPTHLTNTQALRARPLPSDLPVLFTPSPPDAPEAPDTDAGPMYERMILLYQDHPDVLPQTQAHDELVESIAEQLIQAMRAGRVEEGFMDRHLPVEIGAEPGFGDAVESAYELAIHESARRYTHGDPQGAKDLALAVWALGRRMVEANVRMYPRVVGLDMMESAGSMLYPMAVDGSGLDAQALTAWAQAIKEIRSAWQPKLQIVMGVDPPIGDLVNIALHDEDRMFRVEATLRLGIFKHAAGGRANRRLILDTITKAMKSDDPLIAQAGRVADGFTLEEKRRLY